MGCTATGAGLPQAGEAVTLSLDVDELHLFDAAGRAHAAAAEPAGLQVVPEMAA